MFNEKVLEKSNKQKIRQYKIVKFLWIDIMWLIILFAAIYNISEMKESILEYIIMLFCLSSFGMLNTFLYLMLCHFSNSMKISKQRYLSIKNKTYQLTDTYVTDVKEHVEVDYDEEDGTTITRVKIISFQGLPNTFTASMSNNFRIGERVVVQTFKANIKGQISYPVINVWRY